jgi:hypothetical protein
LKNLKNIGFNEENSFENILNFFKEKYSKLINNENVKIYNIMNLTDSNEFENVFTKILLDLNLIDENYSGKLNDSLINLKRESIYKKKQRSKSPIGKLNIFSNINQRSRSNSTEILNDTINSENSDLLKDENLEKKKQRKRSINEFVSETVEKVFKN